MPFQTYVFDTTNLALSEIPKMVIVNPENEISKEEYSKCYTRWFVVSTKNMGYSMRFVEDILNFTETMEGKIYCTSGYMCFEKKDDALRFKLTLS